MRLCITRHCLKILRHFQHTQLVWTIPSTPGYAAVCESAWRKAKLCSCNSCFCPQLNRADESMMLPGSRCRFSILHLVVAEGHWTLCPIPADRGFYLLSFSQRTFIPCKVCGKVKWVKKHCWLYEYKYKHTNIYTQIYGKNGINRTLVLKITPIMLFKKSLETIMHYTKNQLSATSMSYWVPTITQAALGLTRWSQTLWTQLTVRCLGTRMWFSWNIPTT